MHALLMILIQHGIIVYRAGVAPTGLHLDVVKNGSVLQVSYSYIVL